MSKTKKPTITPKPTAKKPRPFARVVRVKGIHSLFSIRTGDVLLGNLAGPMQVAKERVCNINAAFEAAHAERCAACEAKKAWDRWRVEGTADGYRKPATKRARRKP